MTGWLLPFLCALGCGILSAWGIGGGTLLLLIMTLFLDMEQRAAQGINLLFFLPTAAAGLLCHLRSGFVDSPAVKNALPAALPCALVGALLASRMNLSLLRRPFGIALLIAAVCLLRPQTNTRLP